jgi:hypothetical protein
MSYREEGTNRIRIQIIERPWQAGCTVKPESVWRGKISVNVGPKVVAVNFRLVMEAYKKLHEDLNLSFTTTKCTHQSISTPYTSNQIFADATQPGKSSRPSYRYRA